MTGKKPKWCLDCGHPSDDTNWCDICNGFVCIDCDDLHDCLGEILPDEDDAPVLQIPDEFDRLFFNDDDDDDSGGHA